MKEIALTNSPLKAIVDDGDLELAMSRKWCLVRDRAESTSRPYIYLHHLIAGKPPKPLEIDHRNGDSLDNRRENLRQCTRTENVINRGHRKDSKHRFKGLLWRSKRHRFEARIVVNGKKIYLGYFKDSIEGAKCYDAAAKKYHGEFANLNFVGEHDGNVAEFGQKR